MDAPSRSVTRSLVGAREVYLCDNLFDEATVSRVADLLKTLRYRRVERSRTAADISGCSAEVPEHVASSEPLFAQLKAFAEEMFVARDLGTQRLYVNSTVYGDMYYPHRDFGENQQHITMLYYTNPKWSTDWGGETVLYDDDGDAQMAVTPRPGRVVAFRGAILHRGGVPTRICYEERLTVAVKLRVPETGTGSATADSGEMGEGTAAATRSTAESVEAVSAAVAANDFALAARLAGESLSAGLVHPAFFNARALQAEREGRDEEALDLYEQARKLSPRNAHLLNAMGLCLTRLSRFQEAIYAFDQSVRLSPAHAPTHHWLGVALGLAGRWELAERAHARAAQLDPRHAEAIASVAAIAARKGDGKVARSHADRALKLDPSNATARAALATIESGK
ncbi:MAG: 2OG-Fe(II) oxygenase [Rhizomicrobium sp.]